MYTFRKAQPDELPQIWEIIQHAIARRKAEGSDQWRDGYPNPEVSIGTIMMFENQICKLGIIEKQTTTNKPIRLTYGYTPLFKENILFRAKFRKPIMQSILLDACQFY